MRTPVVMIIGLVLAPCGFLLSLIATFSPDWRELRSVSGAPVDEIIQQGIWDVCIASDISSSITCGQSDTTYFSQQVITVARGLMLTSLLVMAGGIVMASLGVRCWQENPNWLIAGLSGILIFISGVLSLIPVAYYTNLLSNITTTFTAGKFQVGYSIVIGYISSCFELIGGAFLILCLFHLCKRRNEKQANSFYNKYYRESSPKSRIRTIDVPDMTWEHRRSPSFGIEDFSQPPNRQTPREFVSTDFTRNEPCDADL
ncbi:claudin-23-like [Erpetoichthys calabaricus]|uniref:claudin-23-like n=1 Tax=Erpetoichthys calabaricus TaxID=27687 RepID=UPI0010A05C1A|nr:claudin-23-like [Erpetoichthys calabaricus]